MLKNVKEEMHTYALNVISKAKSNLQKSNNSGTLKNSLDYKIDESDPNNVKLDFYGEFYANFVDQGVQGNNPNAMPKGSLARYNKAPMSPYKFGSGNFSGSGSLRGSIDKWVVQKGIPNVRDEKGRFIKRKTMVFLISRSIWNTGLRATKFLENAMESEKRNFKNKVRIASVKDMVSDLRENIKK
jgi:hypothetical protein